MYLLDTDTFSNLIAKNRQTPVLDRRFRREPLAGIHISVILVEEYLNSILPDINKYHSSEKVVQVYEVLRLFLQEVERFDVLPFDEPAYEQYLKIPDKIRQAHRRDCRVAAIAATRGYTVVTGNTRDFGKIAIAHYENWMIEENSDEPR